MENTRINDNNGQGAFGVERSEQEKQIDSFMGYDKNGLKIPQKDFEGETDSFGSLFLDMIEDGFADISFRLFSEISSAFTEVLMLLVILIAFIMGFMNKYNILTPTELPWRLFFSMTLLSLFFVDDGKGMMTEFWYYFTEWPLDAMGYFANAGSTLTNQSSFISGIDANFAVIFSVVEALWEEASLTNVFKIVTNLQIMVASAVIGLEFAVIYAKFLLNVIVALGAIYLIATISGPIILLSMFSTTRKYTFNMIRALFQYSITMILSGGILGLFSSIIEFNAQLFLEKLNPEADNLQNILFTSDFAGIVLSGIVLFFLLSKAAEISSMITASVASNASGFGTTLKKFFLPGAK